MTSAAQRIGGRNWENTVGSPYAIHRMVWFEGRCWLVKNTFYKPGAATKIIEKRYK